MTKLAHSNMTSSNVRVWRTYGYYSDGYIHTKHEQQNRAKKTMYPTKEDPQDAFCFAVGYEEGNTQHKTYKGRNVYKEKNKNKSLL